MSRIDFNLEIIFRVDWELLFAGGTEKFSKIVQWAASLMLQEGHFTSTLPSKMSDVSDDIHTPPESA